jgi:hypothetical protein
MFEISRNNSRNSNDDVEIPELKIKRKTITVEIINNKVPVINIWLIVNLVFI